MQASQGFAAFHLTPSRIPPRRSQRSWIFCDFSETPFLRFLQINRIRLLHLNKKYYTQSADQEDLISIGTIGLIKGISTFDASKGARLATYAARCVENEILMYFRSQRKGSQDVSLSDCIETGRDGSALSLMDTICSEEDLFEDLSTRELHGQLRAVMEQVLTPREKAIVSLRYGLSGGAPLTQREIAEQCGISRSYVSRIEKKALRAIREALDGKDAP